ANRSRMSRSDAKLLVVNGNMMITTRLIHLPKFMQKGDVLVVNDSATIPASFKGYLGNRPVELRLATNLHLEFDRFEEWRALIFNAGSSHLPTEKRGIPPIQVGDQIYFSRYLTAEVIDLESDRIIKIRFCNTHSSPLIQQLFRLGTPIQYAYLQDKLEVYDQQTIFAGTPASVEPPSAAFQFTWKLVNSLKVKGVTVVPITHSAGISSTGSKEQDQRLPFEEKYRISKKTGAIINAALEEGRRVITLGTTVIRAVESAANNGKVEAGTAFTTLKIDRDFKPQIVSGILTGMHIPDESHMQIIEAFSCRVEEAYQMAKLDDFLWHEYGDMGFFIRDSWQ
ncbi:MAG: hypothetical protein D6698_15350, partial [Gammaproteobacteria bacterium]